MGVLAIVLLREPTLGVAEEKEDKAQAEEKVVPPQSKAAYERGQKQAHDAIAHNMLALEQPGLPAPWVADYSSKLRKDYHVELRLSGCVVRPDFLSFMQGYNEVMVEEIERRYGKDVLRRTAEQAQKSYQAWSSGK